MLSGGVDLAEKQQRRLLPSSVEADPGGVTSHRVLLPRRALAIPLVLSGVAAVTVAVVGLRATGDGPGNDREVAVDASVRTDPAAVTVGPTDVTVVSMTYEPGESSGWHVHHGMHAVAVISGTLTLYDGTCHVKVVGPGESYVGGRELHLARNETPTPVGMVVTYLEPGGSGDPTFNVPMSAPQGCTVQTERTS